MTINNDHRNVDANRDPLTGATGAHPVGTGIGAVGSEMSSDWAASRGASSLSWERARHAARDAWNRISPSS